jgi:hypothetical protein
MVQKICKTTPDHIKLASLKVQSQQWVTNLILALRSNCGGTRTQSSRSLTTPPIWNNTTRLWLQCSLLHSCSTFLALKWRLPHLPSPYPPCDLTFLKHRFLAPVVWIPIAILSWCSSQSWEPETKWAFTNSPNVGVLLTVNAQPSLNNQRSSSSTHNCKPNHMN